LSFCVLWYCSDMALHGLLGNLCFSTWSTSSPYSLNLLFMQLFLTLFFLTLLPVWHFALSSICFPRGITIFADRLSCILSGGLLDPDGASCNFLAQLGTGQPQPFFTEATPAPVYRQDLATCTQYRMTPFHTH